MSLKLLERIFINLYSPRKGFRCGQVLQVINVMKDIKGRAIVLTDGHFEETAAKTAHGLIRGSRRFEIIGVIDQNYIGQDAGKVLDGKHRNIPFFGNISDALQGVVKPDYCIIGVATHGGVLPEDLRRLVLEAIENGLSIVNGLHECTCDIPEIATAAKRMNVQLIDIRKPKPTSELHFWHGEILTIKKPTIAVLGIDCAVGKRTTCGFLEIACNEAGIKTEMIYTGQTGWLQGYEYGFIFDSTLNDFVGGEIEHSIMECVREKNPDLILIEGQSSLRNPSGPCGTEFLLSGQAKGVILQYTPFQKYVDGVEQYGYLLPDLASEIKIIELYGSKVLAVTLNGKGGTAEDLIERQKVLQQQFDIPIIRPLEEGMIELVSIVKEFMRIKS